MSLRPLPFLSHDEEPYYRYNNDYIDIYITKLMLSNEYICVAFARDIARYIY